MLSLVWQLIYVLAAKCNTCRFIDFIHMLWEGGCCYKESSKMGELRGKKWQEEENSRERLSPSLERRRALDFLFAAICLVLLREINSPRHTDQYSLNPHLIWQEFPPISPSLPPPPPPHPLSLCFYFPSPLVFSHFSCSWSEHVT